MELTVGAILEGKVKSITKFGAFITLPEGQTGLVHISEVAYTYVADVHEFLTEGQDVRVVVLNIDPAGKISLSIKRTQPRPQQPARTASADRPQQAARAPQAERPARTDRPQSSFRQSTPRSGNSTRSQQPRQPLPTDGGELLPPSNDRSFEDKLKAFMSESDSKLAGVRQYEHKTKSRRR